MLVWSERFETKIEIVDKQHKRLCDLLNMLADKFTVGIPSEAEVEQTLKELLDYANLHFADEEKMMESYKMDPHYLAIHRMEHHSFIYDLSRLQLHINPDENETQTAQRLVRFITSWLVYHILGVDQNMAAQMRAIDQGMSPEAAYQSCKDMKRDAATTQLILNSVLDLWRDTAEHSRILEEKLLNLTQSTGNN